MRCARIHRFLTYFGRISSLLVACGLAWTSGDADSDEQTADSRLIPWLGHLQPSIPPDSCATNLTFISVRSASNFGLRKVVVVQSCGALAAALSLSSCVCCKQHLTTESAAVSCHSECGSGTSVMAAVRRVLRSGGGRTASTITVPAERQRVIKLYSYS